MLRVLGIILLICLSAGGNAQSINNIVFDEENQEMIVTGRMDIAGLQGDVFGSYYIPEYESYQPDPAIIQNLISLDAPGFEYIIILGTWCSDSQREVPRMTKVLQLSGLDVERIQICAVDHQKKAECGFAELAVLDVQKVPLLIILKEGEEAGRIIESPVLSIEEDIQNILLNSVSTR